MRFVTALLWPRPRAGPRRPRRRCPRAVHAGAARRDRRHPARCAEARPVDPARRRGRAAGGRRRPAAGQRWRRRGRADRSARDPVAGNPHGDVTVVEFYDLRCPYCRMLDPVIDALLTHDPDVRLVYKDIPILGPGQRARREGAAGGAEAGRLRKAARRDHDRAATDHEAMIQEAATEPRARLDIGSSMTWTIRRSRHASMPT